MRGMNLIFIPLIIFFITLFLVSGSSAEDEEYIKELLFRADTLRLYKERYWDVLLHYKKTLSGRVSYIDDPKFFLSPSGKTDPKRELEETIRGFFRKDINDNGHPICRFPARFQWLKKMLLIDESKLPIVDCKDLKDALERVKPQKAVLVFPASYMNAPASMFGHTLLRIDGQYQSKLLSHAVNYAADTEEAGGFVYAFRGIFGGFKGYYAIFPYYQKVTQYNDIDHRDMWEYELDLNEKEVETMFLHIWELKDIYQNYYFFDENCSYNLLFLIESARPELYLTDRFKGWVIPIDTIRVIKSAGIIKNITYRPSIATRIKHMSDKLSKREKKVVLEIVNKGNAESIPEDLGREDKIKMLDLASEYIQYRFSRKKITKEEYTKKFIQILGIRKNLGKIDDTVYSMPVPPFPEEGHDSNRIYISMGLRKKEIFYEIRIRPAYHDLSDHDDGYDKGSQIVFLDFSLRYFPEEKDLNIQAIDIIDIFSISPRDEFFKPKSWRIYAGLNRQIIRDDDHLVTELKGGMGIAKNIFSFILYTLIEGDIKFQETLRYGYSTGFGIQMGLIGNPSDFWKIHIYSESMRYFIGDKDTYTSIHISNNFRLEKDMAIRLNMLHQKTYDRYLSEITSGVIFYF